MPTLYKSLRRTSAMTTSINPRDVPIDEVRELARDHAERTSLRQLAPEIGLGHSTLHNFLSGAAPHPRVRRLLGLWYLRVTGGSAEDFSLRPYAAALDVLLAEVPAESRGRAAGEVLDVLERGYAASGAGIPPWLAALRARGAEGSGD
jgi:hypothetical protein